MKKFALPLVLLALAFVFLAIWRLTRNPSTTAPEEAAVPAAPAQPKEAVTEDQLAGLDHSDPTLAETDREDLPTAAAGEQGLETWEIARSIWVEGTVRSPGGCVDEGPVEVFAIAEATDADALARLLDRGHPSKPLLSRRKVGPDGAFRVPFPPETKTGYVSMRGRFLYLQDSVAVEVATGARTLVLEPRCGAWFRGTIGLPAQSTVAMAELDGLDVTLRSSFQGMSGAVSSMRGFRRRGRITAGEFEFRAVPVDTGSVVEIEPTKLAAVAMEIEKPQAGREVPVRVDLLRGGTVTGTVRDEGGHPVVAAGVEAARPGQWFGFDNKVVRSGKTGADGTFELQAVTPGSIVVQAELDGYLQSERSKIDLADGGITSAVELQLTLGNKVAGAVAWADGKPAAGVVVEAAFDRSQLFGMGAFNAARGANGKATADAEGKFAITGLGKGPFTLQVAAPPPGEPQAAAPAPSDGELKPEKPGQAKSSTDDKTKWRARADGIQPGASDVALVLRPPVGVPGRVVDENAKPIAKFQISAVRQGKGPMGDFGEEERKDSFEDADGHFLLTGLIEGTWNVYASADGFGRSEPTKIELPHKAEDPELSIALEHAASVAGVVKSPGGQPVSGATVAIDTGDPSWKAMIQSGPKPPSATSTSDGTFVLDGLHSGKAHIAANSKDYAKSLPVDLELAIGQHVTGIEITLRDGGVLTGEVFSDGGKPATGMFVQVVQMKDFDTKMSFTGSKGEFRVEHLLPGSWQVIAMPSRGEPGSVGSDSGKEGTDAAMSMFQKMKMTVATIVEGEETHVVLGAPPKDPVDVHGTVTHAGEPCGGSMLSFVAEGKEPLKSMKTCQVGKDGAYSVKLDEPGHYSVSVQQAFGGMGQQSTVEFPEEIPEGKEYRLDLAMPTARISGLVLGADGAASAGTRVSLHPESPVAAGTMWGGQYHEGVTDADGRFDVKMLRAGTYTLSVGGMTFGGMLGGDAGPGREIRGGLRLSDGEWMRDVDFRLKKAGTLEVSVVDAGGAPVQDASVFARDGSGRLVDGLSMITTDANGKAHYKGLGPGTYTILARKDLLTSVESAHAKIEEGGQAEASVALQPGTVLLVTCLGAESKPVRASLSVQDEAGHEVGAMISLSEAMKMFNENGFSTTERRIGPLPQGKYTVRAVDADGKTVTKPVTLTGQAERKITIHLD
ncbi:MAG TPA: carboxypeptidase-like regulatory domain-containing protein [Planctomycetota bacterium]|jgi:hypothetical protein|nr:carboxypeptidase-like regulatory domain-containing protein [Planctomycetota bacterium]